VTKVRRGDRVVMVSPSCGSCAACRRGLPGYCAAARKIKFSGRLRDGREPFRRGSTPVFGAFFQQSSFATHTLATEGNVVRLPDDLPLEVAAAFACGVNTGAGAVLNVLKLQPGSSVAVFGAGSVGLAAVMAARIAGCATIFAVDLQDNRLELARELGATHVSRQKPPLSFDFTLEAAGSPQALRDAVDCLATLGTCCLVGSARKGTEARLEMAQLQHGRTLRGCIQGDAPPAEFFPLLFDLWRSGRLPVERLIGYYDFAEVNRAVADSLSGKTVKPVLRIS
jgi:aryl-alcohol dehydrogenase